MDIPDVPIWLTELKDWVVILSPIWGLALVLVIKPVRIFIINMYQKFVGQPIEAVQKQTEHNSVMEEGVKALLHNQIYNNAMSMLDKGECSVSEFENLEELFKPYEELGGNGTAHKLYEECKNLKTSGK